jgi:hypothetical protein
MILSLNYDPILLKDRDVAEFYAMGSDESPTFPLMPRGGLSFIKERR